MICTTALLLFFLLLLFYFPVWKQSKPNLPVLRYGRTDRPNASPLIEEKKLEKQFLFLLKKGFNPILPQELSVQNGLLKTEVKKPVILLFCGGYESIYLRIFPLLKKHNIKAVIGLPVSLIGQYDAWENAEKGPWQNLLTQEEIKRMSASGLVSFASHGLDYSVPGVITDQALLSQAAESRYRLEKYYKLSTSLFVFPGIPSKQLAQDVVKDGYLFSVSYQPGTSLLPASVQTPLKTFPMHKRTFLPRLYLKMTR